MTNTAVRSGQVVVCRGASSNGAAAHEWMTHMQMAARLAALKRYEFVGEYEGSRTYGRLYFVPVDTLQHAQAQQLGVCSEDDFFGGCVIEPFAATKSITHPLVDHQAARPPGWSDAFPLAVANAVLLGFSVFSRPDARRAASRLLALGQVRMKPALGIGGAGQHVLRNLDDLNTALGTISADNLARYGVVLEQNLDQVTTYSVGQVQVENLRLSYHGKQHLTTNHQGEQVYGGSRLHVVRGDYCELLELPMTPNTRLAIDQACCYDAAATTHLGLLASRRNYDVAQGIDSHGGFCSGVLEQSWRLGGASPGEIAALEVFAADPKLRTVAVSTHEIYGNAQPPANASVHYCGIDARDGALLKYCTIDDYEYSTDQT